MKVPAKIIDQIVNEGRTYILLPGSRVRVWRAYRWPADRCFSGQRAWDVVAPNGAEFVLEVSEGDPRPLFVYIKGGGRTQ